MTMGQIIGTVALAFSMVLLLALFTAWICRDRGDHRRLLEGR